MTLHVHRIEPGTWVRGKNVEIRGDTLHCDLDFSRPYSFVDATAGFLATGFQAHHPHLEFLKLEENSELLLFVRRWGPIAMSTYDRVQGESNLPVSRYWLWHRYLHRVLELLSAVRRQSDEARALGGYLELRGEFIISLSAIAESQCWGIPEDAEYVEWVKKIQDTILKLPHEADWLGVQRGRPGQISAILQSEPSSYVCRLMDMTIFNFLSLITAPYPLRRTRREQPILVASLKADDLRQAMECLIILDECKDHGLRQCDECATLFRSDTRHQRRYCTPDCARRVSSRLYKRKLRAKQKGATGRKP